MTLARPYAKAMFESALSHRVLDETGQHLEQLAMLLQQPVVQVVVRNPLHTPEMLVERMVALLPDIRDGLCHKLLRVLAYERRLLVLPALYEHFVRHCSDHLKQCNVQVCSAVPLDASFQERLVLALQQRLGVEGIQLDCQVDSDLIAGAWVRVGDSVIDGSVKGRLQRLAASLAE